MTVTRKFFLFAAALVLSLFLVEIYARHTVRITPAGQALARYQPNGGGHAVFLGSSLTDAGIRASLLDTLLGVPLPGFRAYNLALAGLNGSENYWLIFKGFILPKSRPRYLVVEGAGIPFLPPREPFRLEGVGLRVESFRAEYLDWPGFLYLSGGFPGIAPCLSFLLHRTWFSYHHRHEIQARLKERLIPKEPAAKVKQGNPYRMVDLAAFRFAETARSELRRLESMPDGPSAMRRREAHLLDLAALAKENGVALVILKPPLPPADTFLQRSPAFAAYVRNFRSLCDSLGVRYLDLSGEESCGPYSFSDGIHLDEAGSRRFTACVATALASEHR
ncbi:MAG: hypothetical protein M3Y08_19220 [Fibrobacterota bacterium]|nr:hypothetical protein [Fibrobacterota bacterium]